MEAPKEFIQLGFIDGMDRNEMDIDIESTI